MKRNFLRIIIKKWVNRFRPVFMNKKLLFLISIPVLVILALLMTGKVNKNKINMVCFGNHCFLAELAESRAERERGLMFRKSLDSDKGMLFVFEEEEEYPFWMKNTLIPLDMIWINENKEVVFVSKNVQPCEGENHCLSINPNKKAKYVLEINAGSVKEAGIEIGDKVDLGVFTD